MVSNILVTGAGGYIGGTVVADLLANTSELIRKGQVIAAVRSTEQADALSSLGVRVIQMDLSEKKLVTESVLHNNIDVVLHTAGGLSTNAASNLVGALGEQKRVTGRKTYFVHTSGSSAFYEKVGWPSRSFKDTDAIFDTEKSLEDSYPLRKTDVMVIEQAKALGVTSFIVVPPVVYGRGSGEWNQLSLIIPLYIRASISAKAVSKFPGNQNLSGVHVSDLAALYRLIAERALQGESIRSGKEGYYFAMAHDLFLGELGDHLAKVLRDRGLTTDSTTRNYLDANAAAESLGIPLPVMEVLWESGPEITTTIPRKIGWKPSWDKRRFLQNIDSEVQDVVDLGTAKSSLVASLIVVKES